MGAKAAAIGLGTAGVLSGILGAALNKKKKKKSQEQKGGLYSAALLSRMTDPKASEKRFDKGLGLATSLLSGYKMYKTVRNLNKNPTGDKKKRDQMLKSLND